jgi:hypothetical protein
MTKVRSKEQTCSLRRDRIGHRELGPAETGNPTFAKRIAVFKDFDVKTEMFDRNPSSELNCMGGTGKHTAARFAAFAAFVAEMEVFELQPTKEYRMTDFCNNLKGLFKTAGLQGREVMC